MTLLETLLLAWAVIATVGLFEYRKMFRTVMFTVFCILDDEEVYKQARTVHEQRMKEMP